MLGLFIMIGSCEKRTPDEEESPEDTLEIMQKDDADGLNSIENEISLSYLFTDISQYKYIHPAYSADAGSGAPWGFKHQGIDLITADSAYFLAPADGEILQLVLYLNPINSQWQVNMHIRYNNRFSYNLMIEPRAHTEEEVAIQRAAIRVNEHDRVTGGDTLGMILNLSGEETGYGDVTVHFDLWVDGQNVCPEPYFRPDVLAVMMTLLHYMYPDGQLCYPSSSTTSVKEHGRI